MFSRCAPAGTKTQNESRSVAYSMVVRVPFQRFRVVSNGLRIVHLLERFVTCICKKRLLKTAVLPEPVCVTIWSSDFVNLKSWESCGAASSNAIGPRKKNLQYAPVNSLEYVELRLRPHGVSLLSESAYTT